MNRTLPHLSKTLKSWQPVRRSFGEEEVCLALTRYLPEACSVPSAHLPLAFAPLYVNKENYFFLALGCDALSPLLGRH